MEIDMAFDNIAAARGVITVLKCMGLWRYKAPWHLLYGLYAGALHFLFTFPYTFMMWKDTLQAQDLEKFTYVMYMSLTELALVVKVGNVWLHSARFVQFFHSATHEEIFTLHAEHERAVWRRQQRFFRLLVLMYFGMSLTLVTSAFLGVLFEEEYELPFPYAPPFEWRNARNYRYAYGYELVAMPVTCLSNCAVDMIQCYMLLHLALCYKLVGQRLELMGQNNILSGLKAGGEQRFYRKFIEIISLHKEIRRISRDVEIFISFPFVIQIICSAFVLCFSAYRLQTLNIRENPSQFLTLMLAVVVMTLQIFVPCFYGNEIILNSHALNNCIYNSDWLPCSPKMRKYLFVYMEFLKKPVRIRAGNFFEIGLPIFTKTINNTYSLMALLLNMNK